MLPGATVGFRNIDALKTERRGLSGMSSNGSSCAPARSETASAATRRHRTLARLAPNAPRPNHSPCDRGGEARTVTRVVITLRLTYGWLLFYGGSGTNQHGA